MYAVVKTGGKQYLVKQGDTIVVDRLVGDAGKKTKLDTLLSFSEDGETCNVGKPLLEKATEAEIMEHGKGDKIRIAKFKAKVRYRRVRGFRPSYSRIRITRI